MDLFLIGVVYSSVEKKNKEQKKNNKFRFTQYNMIDFTINGGGEFILQSQQLLINQIWIN
jgi:hypothetical protein